MNAASVTQDVAHAAAVLAAGGVAIVPTDTVYGVAAALNKPGAIDRIYQAKGRSDGKPIPILVDGRRTAELLASSTNDAARRLMCRCWPGPLTIIVPASSAVPAACLAGGVTVGLRMPDHAMLLELLTACGGALAVTSANRSGHPETSTAADAFAELGDRVDVVLDAGRSGLRAPSAVVDPSGEQLRVIRAGPIDTGLLRSIAAGE